MPILALEALLRQNKKNQWKILSPVGIEPLIGMRYLGDL